MTNTYRRTNILTMININDCAPTPPDPISETESNPEVSPGPDTPEKPRRRGGQPGNRNAVTHGFYARPLPADREEAMSQADEVEGLDEEIAFLRYKLRRLEQLDPDNIKLAVQAINTLSNVLVRRRYVLVKDKNGIAKILKELLNGVVLPVVGVKEAIEG